MTKHEADVIGGLNMTDQISNEAYKQIMIATQDENEVGEVLYKIRAEIERKANSGQWSEAVVYGMKKSIVIIDKYRAESEDRK